MHIPIPKYLLFILYFLFSYTIMHAHGFSYNTGISADSGRCLALGSMEKGFKWIASYNFALQSPDFSIVQAAGVSRTNCYFRLQLDNDAPGCNNEILCTPTQLFYVSSKKTWVPALDLQVGDELLGMHNTIERIAYLEFVNKPLDVHTIEVEDHHNFFVGCRHHAVLVHNMLAPVSMWVGLSVAFGQGAAVGGGTGSFLGPVTVVGGIVIGGLVGVVVHSLWRPRFKYSLAFNASGICEYKLKSNDAVYVDANTCYFKPRENAAGAMTASITENYDDSYFSNRFSSVGQQKLVKEVDYNASFNASADGKLTRANKAQRTQMGISSSPLPNPPENDDDKDKESKSKIGKKSFTTVDDILEGTQKGRKTLGRTKQFEKYGGYEEALNDFESLELFDVRNMEVVRIGKLSDGRIVNVRSMSSSNLPTLEIQEINRVNRIKIRYIGGR